MKIIVADKFEESGLNGLKENGFEVIYNPDLKEQSLAEAIENEKPEGLIVRSTRVEAYHLNDSLKLIVRAGSGYNTIATKEAKEKGIQVANCPGKNANAVAELTIGLILSLDRRIPDNVIQFRQGKWNKKEFSKAKGIKGKTLGVVGFGTIGQIVSDVAKALGMEVIVFSRHLTEQEAQNLQLRKVKDLNELAWQSDIVTVHTALDNETKNLLDEEFFANMKAGAFFVNTSRNEVVNQQALEKAIAEKGIRAGLDVMDDEPNTTEGEYSGRLKDNPNVYCTHHIGASTEQAQDAVAEETVRIFVVFRETGKAPNCVNC